MAWSAGTSVVAYSDADGNLYVADGQGANAKTLFQNDGTRSMQALDVSPDGKQLLALSLGDQSQLVLVPLGGGTPAAVAGTDGADFGSMSPDGKQIVFSLNEYSSATLGAGIYTVAVGGGTPKRLLATPTSGFDSLPAYSPDGTKIAFTRDTYDAQGNETVTLELVGAAGGSPTALATGLVADLSGGGRLSFSPDGAKIAYAGDYENPGVFTVGVGGGEPARLTSDFDYWPSFSLDGATVFFSRDATSQNADDNAARPAAPITGDDFSELWTVKKDGSGAVVLAEGDFETLALGEAAAASAAAPAPTTTTAAPGNANTPTTTAKPGARASRSATSIRVKRNGTRYTVTWAGKALSWRVTLKVGARSASTRVKGTVHAQTFVLRGASGRATAKVVPA